MPGTAGAHHTQHAGTVGGKLCTGRNASSEQQLEQSKCRREWDGLLSRERLVTAPGEAAGNEQVPQARVRAEERGKDQSEAINRGRKNPGGHRPCNLHSGKMSPNAA